MNHYKLSYKELINELFWFTMDMMDEGKKINYEISKLEREIYDIKKLLTELSTDCQLDSCATTGYNYDKVW